MEQNETGMENHVEQDLEQSGTETEQSETTMENHVKQDLGTDKTLLSKAVSMRQAGKTYREIESTTKIPKATLCRHLKNVVPKTQIIRNSDGDMGSIPSIHTESEPMSPSHFPSEGEAADYPSMSSKASPSTHIPDAIPHYGAGIIPLNEEDRNALRRLYPKNPHLVDSIFEIAETRENQRRQFSNNNGHRNDGHEEPLSQRELLSYLQTKDLIETIKQKRENNAVHPQPSDPIAITKMIFEDYTKGGEHASPKGQTRS